MLTKKKYNRLNIHEKINYRASLKRQKQTGIAITEAISFILEFGLSYAKSLIEESKRESVYKKIK